MVRTAAFALFALLVACDRRPAIEDQPIEPAVEPAAPGEETAPLIPEEAPVYYGVWAREAKDCGVAPGSADPAPVAFAEGEFVGYENRCRVGKVEEGTEGGYQLELFCMAEGVETVEEVELDVDGEMLRMRWGDAPETTFMRCKEGK
ncbi:MAG: hypothetical protein AB7P23_08225 [Amphiplicatus sp.]